MIAVHDLDFRYARGGFRLRIPELKVKRGSKTALVGPSGSGKTTLLSLIAGILLPVNGRIFTDQTEITSLGDHARRSYRASHIGLVFQEFELLEHLNVLDNILLPCRISSALRLDHATRQRAIMLAAEVGIRDKLARFVRKLSQGERQRVAICRALLTQPPLLLCDEPTGNLDLANKEHVLDILSDYIDQTGATLVTVTHDNEILDRFDSVIDFRQFRHFDSERS